MRFGIQAHMYLVHQADGNGLDLHSKEGLAKCCETMYEEMHDPSRSHESKSEGGLIDTLHACC